MKPNTQTQTNTFRLIKAVLASTCFMLPGVGKAVDTVIPPAVGPYVAAADGDTLTITSVGNITEGGTDAVSINFKNVVVNVLSSNPASDAIVTTLGSGFDAIEILGGGEATAINIQTGRTVNGDSDGISVAASAVIVNNSGTIKATNNHAISVLPNGKDVTINNLAGGTIESAGPDAIDIDEEGATLTNAGTIKVTGGADNGVQIHKNFKGFSNNPSGVIESDTGNAVIIGSLSGNAVAGTINNTGLIQTKTGFAINIADNLGGNINNLTGGTIQTTDALADGAAIFLQGNVTNINNGGSIIGTNTAEGIRTKALQITANINNNTGGVIKAEAGNAIEIAAGLSGSIVNTAGTIQSDTGIAIDLAPGVFTGNLTNTGGTIKTGNNHAIYLDNLIMNGSLSNANTIVNNATVKGTIENNAAALQTILVDNASVIKTNFENSGTIKNTAAGGAISFDGTTVNGNVTNSAGGIIETAGGTAFGLLNGTVLDLNFTNAGTIHTTLGAAPTILANNGTLIKGSFNITGTVKNSGTGVAVNMDDVTINGNMTNSGTSIIAGDASALVWNDVKILGGFTNSGLIENTPVGVDKPTIIATGTAAGDMVITNGFTNTGTIRNNFAGGVAIDFSDPEVDIKLNQNGGTITGNILLAGGTADGKVFDMNGGTINGDVTATQQAGVPNELNLNGGIVNGNVTLSDENNDTLNLAGTTVNGNIIGGANDNTVNITGGSFTTLDGTGGANTLNIKNSFVTPGTINLFQTINVEAGTFTVNNAITAVDTKLHIFPNAIVDVTGTGSITDGGLVGDLEIDGSLGIRNGGVVTMNGTTNNNDYLGIEAGGLLNTGVYNQAVGAELEVQVKTSFAGPYIDVAGAANVPDGSIIKTQVGGEFIPNGFKTNLINSTNGNYGGNLNDTLVQPASATVTFSVAPDPMAVDNLVLTAALTPLIEVIPPNSDITSGVASTLDSLAAGMPLTTDPDLLLLLGQLQTIPTGEKVEEALRTLVPIYNHSLAANSQFAVHRSFDDIGRRLEELLGMNALLEDVDKLYDDEDEYSESNAKRSKGFNYGDGDGSVLMRHTAGMWVKPYASIISQNARDGVEGYKGDSVGLSIGGDYRILDWATVGAALSLAKTDITQRGLFENKQDIDSYQVTFYGHFDPIGPIYVNTMLGIARHRYQVNRTISVAEITRRADSGYHGLHYAGKVDIGYAWFNGKYYISPIASLMYNRLNIDNYSEKGAGGLNLVVRTEPITEFVGSLGLKLAIKNEFVEATYIPELAMFVNYDFQQNQMETLNNFVAGGPAFRSFGIKPAQTSYVISPSFRMHTHRNMMFKVAYEFEAKDQFIAHSAYFKWYYKWK